MSFEKHTSAVSFYSDPEFYDSLGGNWQGIEKVKGSPYDDSMVHPGIVVDGAGGNDTLLGEGPITLYGGSGNDDLIWRGAHGANGTVGYGGSGNDHLNMMDMTGGTGNDTFELMAYNDVTMPGGTCRGITRGPSCGISTTARTTCRSIRTTPDRER